MQSRPVNWPGKSRCFLLYQRGPRILPRGKDFPITRTPQTETRSGHATSASDNKPRLYLVPLEVEEQSRLHEAEARMSTFYCLGQAIKHAEVAAKYIGHTKDKTVFSPALERLRKAVETIEAA